LSTGSIHPQTQSISPNESIPPDAIRSVTHTSRNFSRSELSRDICSQLIEELIIERGMNEYEACEERFASCFLFFENLIELLGTVYVVTLPYMDWRREARTYTILVKKKKDGASALCGDWGGWWWTRVKRERKPREERENRDRYIIPLPQRARKTQRHEHARAHAHAR